MSGAITVYRSDSRGITVRQASEVEVIPCSSTSSGPSPAAWKPTLWPWRVTSSYGPSGSPGAPHVRGLFVKVSAIESTLLECHKMTRDSGLLDLHARDRPADHQPLDLGGPLEDRPDLGVAV